MSPMGTLLCWEGTPMGTPLGLPHGYSIVYAFVHVRVISLGTFAVFSICCWTSSLCGKMVTQL